MSIPRFIAFLGRSPTGPEDTPLKGFRRVENFNAGSLFVDDREAIVSRSSADGCGFDIWPFGRAPSGGSTHAQNAPPSDDPLEICVKMKWRGPQTSITRARSGMMPCLFIRQEDFIAVASDLSCLVDARLIAPKPDPEVVADHLMFPGNSGRATAVSGVFELFPGETLIFNGRDHKILQDWVPMDSMAHPIDDLDAGASGVRDSIESVFEQLSSRIGNVLVTTSGGLDSSIVGALCAKHFQKVRFVTFFTRDPLGDERAYARCLAEHCGVELIEIDISDHRNDARITAGGHLARPSTRASGRSKSDILLELAAKCRADAIFNGFGGDNVFCFMQSSTPLLDRLYSGFKPTGLRDTTRDLMQMTGCSAPRLLSHAASALARHVQSGGLYNWTTQTRFLGVETASLKRPKYPHPWLEETRSWNLSHLSRTAMLTRAHPAIDRFTRGSGCPNISPLLSGPVLDTCLAIPSWHWCHGGINRAVARMAFAAILPAAILSRVEKGSPVAAYARTYSDNRADLIDFLADGFLADAQIVNSNQIAKFLRSSDPMRNTDFLRILELADTESWCRQILSPAGS